MEVQSQWLIEELIVALLDWTVVNEIILSVQY